MTDEEYLIKLGNRIADMRKQRGLSQTDLAIKCGMDRQNLSNIERGKKNIQAITVYRLARGLEVHVKELVDFE